MTTLRDQQQEATEETTEQEEKVVSRRNFIKGTALAGAGAAAMLQVEQAAADEDDVTDIRIPEEIPRTLAEAAKPANFPMSGAEVFAKFCSDEGVGGFFCCPGNYNMINAIAAEGIPSYGGRCEGNMTSAADGFSRVTGEIAATSGTEGPGFTNMIMNIGAANSARTPLLVIASNKTIGEDDTEHGIQTAYQQSQTDGLKKWGKRLITPNRIYEYAAYAFRELKTGVPKPVHLDFPGEVSGARFEEPGELQYYYDKTRYRTESKPHPNPADISRAVDMIQRAERPMIVASTGVFYDKAWEALLRVAEKNDIAVTESAPQRGHFSDGHPLSASTSMDAVRSADLVILVGQYCMPSIGEFAFGPDAKWIRIDPDATDIGRNVPIDLGIVSSEKAALEALVDALPSRTRQSWRDELAAARQAFDDQSEEYYRLGLQHSAATESIHPAVIGKHLGDFLYQGEIDRDQTTVVSGGYGIGRYTRRYLRAFRPGQICNGAYQYGAIGPDIGYTVGVGAAVQNGIGPQAPYKGAPVFGITGDAGVAYSIMEFDTLGKYRIPAIMLVYNNNAWGVWTSGAGRGAVRAQHMYLFQENLRYEKIAEALGCNGEYVNSPEQLTPALERSYELATREGISTLINCQGKKEFWTNQYPPAMPRHFAPGALAYYK
ncbi:MAG TPA: thiamine pyrophosphate-binding protein [Gammaproteobacteria bacterium]|jgi:thiamine pyrophosphate-dependent acetolactate synthase large subunit-like protein|nr:thiamine pyrophosphate-binding protein [Gammaproteobacteria bacterium]|tara:strand:+ start:27655 stop:29634 length:1980 start_codon:yes stop_codon:yes gene_type:complete